MAWITPKIDWTKEDWFNATDYARIKGNIEYLADYMDADITPMIGKNVADTVYDNQLTLFPHNVYAINQQTYKYTTITDAIYRANEYAPNYEELNRIEGAIFILYNTHKTRAEIMPHLAFRMGGRKAFGRRI